MNGIRAFRSIVASVVFVALTAAPAYPWHDPGILGLAIDPVTPTTIYAATSPGGSPWGTVVKTTDGGVSWQATGLIRTHISILGIDPLTPSTLYAGTDSGVVKTPDGGASWHATDLTNNVSALAINPLRPTTVYAGRAWDAYGQAWGGLFESTDGGVSWRAIHPTEPAYSVYSVVPALAIDPVTPTTVYAPSSSYSGVFKTTDGGATWAAITWSWNTGPAMALAIDPVTTTTVYAGASAVCCDEYSGDVLATGGIFKSTDGGASWQALVLSDALTLWALVIDPRTTTTVYAGTGSGVSKSTDGGASWQAAGLTEYNVRALAIDPLTPSTLYAGTDTGVFKSTDGGTTWSDTGLVLIQQPPFISVSLNPTAVFYGASSTGTVTLATPAPAGGAVVTLSSDTPAVATVPASVTVPTGATSANFMVSTSPITWAVRILATFDGVTASANLMVYATTLDFMSLSPTSVPGGTPSTGTVRLGAAAPAGGAVIPLSSSNPAVATVPASVTVPAGATWANFTVSTSSVTASTTVTISAENYWAVLTVIPGPTLSSVSLDPSSVRGGTVSTGTVTLSGLAPAGGAAVALSSSDTTVATVPASVTVPAGTTTANFPVSTGSVCASAAVTISGTYEGVTKSAGLTVSPPTTTDTITIQQADYFASKRELRVAAKSTSSTATLRVFVTSTGDLIGALTKGGDGRYSGQFTWPVNPQNIAVRSSLCGSATKAVTPK